MSRKKAHTFFSVLEYISGTITHTGIVLPEKTLQELNQPKRVRIEGTINGTPFNLAIQHIKDGRRFLMVGNTLRKEAKLKAGDKVEVIFTLADPDEIKLPEELTEVMEQDPEGKAVFSKFTPGLQRSLAHYVTSAKQVDTRIKRALELMDKAKSGRLHVQQSDR